MNREQKLRSKIRHLITEESEAIQNDRSQNDLREVIRSTIKEVIREAGGQQSMFSVSASSDPTGAIKRADRFEVQSSIPEDFGKHFESRDVKEVMEFLEGHAMRGSGADEYEVTAYQGRTILEVIPGETFLRIARNANLTPRP